MPPPSPTPKASTLTDEDDLKHGLRLAEKLVRRRTRHRATQVLRERYPGVFQRLDEARLAAWAFPVSPTRFEDTTMHLLGRVWRRELKTGCVQFPAVVAQLDCGTFLRDLCAFCMALEDPASASDAFYRLFPAFGERVEDWHAEATGAVAIEGVPIERFRRKCFGAALYHLLMPLRTSRGPGVHATSFEDDPMRLLETIDTRGWHHDLYFAVALGQAMPAAVTRFYDLYSGVVRRYFARRNVDRDRLDDYVRDFGGECILYCCSYFASGPFQGWLGGQCRSYVRRWATPLSSDADVAELEHAPSFDADVGEVAQRAWQRLTSGQRDVLLWHLIEHLTLEELASQLDVHKSTVLRKRVVAEQALRKNLRDEVRQIVGDAATDEECTEFLLEHAKQLDFGAVDDNRAEQPDPGEGPPAEESEPADFCPMVPHAIP